MSLRKCLKVVKVSTADRSGVEDVKCWEERFGEKMRKKGKELEGNGKKDKRLVEDDNSVILLQRH
jgi:hypothetical protein